MTRIGIAKLLVILALGGAGCAAPREKPPVTLILADTFPSSHYAHDAVVRPFMREAEARAGGRLHFDFRPNSTEGNDKEMLRLVQEGAVDFGLVTPSIETGRFPLSAVAELPGSSASACGATEALIELTREGGPIYRSDFEPLGIVPVVRIVLWYYPIIVSDGVQLRTAEDLKGLRLRAGTDAMAMTLRSLGAEPLRRTPAQIGPAIAAGELDGAVVPYRTALDYNWLTWAASGLSGQSFGSIALTLSISRDRWDALPREVRRALLEAGERASLDGCHNLDKVFADAEQDIAAKGLKLQKLSPSELAQIKSRFLGVRKAWAHRVDAVGLPGSSTLETFERLAGPPRP